ncbi:quinol monooxygenase YgiN [Stackebrandtia albiflava]|uniref:Quinol monooxygenase YgiN n=1 Tax=Stackebrandtia albiflava TaxID=406432 RepID=A0A562VDE8_9ACTN|nr:putative quinol monooxygenase [Stackebrandtia albiflava]TWJ15892.1 quinol monooxygenase YgiN [Stackebrandtia albiflava]
MIIVHAEVRLLPEHRDAGLRLLRELAERTRSGDRGCLEYRYHVDVDDPLRLVCVEVWTDEAALREHLAAPHMNDPRSRFSEYTDGSEQVRVYRAEPVRPEAITG